MRTTQEIEQTLRELTLAAKPLSEATFIRGVTLIVAALEAQRTGCCDPTHFEAFVLEYILRNHAPESKDERILKSAQKIGL
jgi:hypothetical protein